MYAFNNAPRCGAKAKVNNGNPCRCPAIKGKARCRLHGGAKGSGAPLGNANALVHGVYTAEANAFKQKIRQTIRLSKALLNEIS